MTPAHVRLGFVEPIKELVSICASAPRIPTRTESLGFRQKTRQINDSVAKRSYHTHYVNSNFRLFCARFYSCKEGYGKTSINQLEYKDWKQQAQEIDTLQRQGQLGLSKNNKYCYPGTFYESSLRRFYPSREQSHRKVLDPVLNFQKSAFKLNKETHHYELDGTRIPERFDHWIEAPGDVKNSRDLRLLKKIQRARERAAAKFKSRFSHSSTRSPENHIMTRRMLRINHLLLETFNQKLLDIVPPSSTQPLVGRVHFTKVQITKDLSQADVYWECVDSEYAASTERTLKHVSKSLQHLVAQTVNMKYRPQFHFIRETLSQKRIETQVLLDTVEQDITKMENNELNVVLRSNSPQKIHVVMADRKGATLPERTQLFKRKPDK